MTPPKKWPENAEWARLDAICAFDEIRKRTAKVQRMIVDGHGLEAMFLLSQISDSAAIGKEKLNEVKGKQ